MTDNLNRIMTLGLNRLNLLAALFPMDETPTPRPCKHARPVSRAELSGLFADDLGYR